MLTRPSVTIKFERVTKQLVEFVNDYDLTVEDGVVTFTDIDSDLVTLLEDHEYEILSTEDLGDTSKDDIDTILEKVEFLEEYPEYEDAFMIFIENYDFNGEDSFLDSYLGVYDSGGEFAEQFLDDAGYLKDLPDFIRDCIDFEDCFQRYLQYDYSVFEEHGGIYIFLID